MEYENQNLEVSKGFKEAYDEQYTLESGIWRHLGALQKVKNIMKIANGYSFEKVLEVGAGDGSILEILSENGFANEYHAVEISKSGIKKIISKEIDNLKSIHEFDGYKLPFPDQSVDLIILSHVLEHVEHERILLREIRRVAKFALIEVPKDYRYGADNKIKHFLSYGHINIYTPTSLKFLLKTENFKILKSQIGVYSKETFLTNKASIFGKLKGFLNFYFKILFTHTPFNYINHKFINTITLLVEPEQERVNIL